MIIYSVFKFHQSTTSNTSVDVASHTQTTTIDIQQKMSKYLNEFLQIKNKKKLKNYDMVRILTARRVYA